MVNAGHRSARLCAIALAFVARPTTEARASPQKCPSALSPDRACDPSRAHVCPQGWDVCAVCGPLGTLVIRRSSFQRPGTHHPNPPRFELTVERDYNPVERCVVRNGACELNATWSYDDRGRLTSHTIPPGNVELRWSKGQKTLERRDGYMESWTYDAQGRIKEHRTYREKRNHALPPPGHSVSNEDFQQLVRNEYDHLGNLKNIWIHKSADHPWHLHTRFDRHYKNGKLVYVSQWQNQGDKMIEFERLGPTTKKLHTAPDGTLEQLEPQRWRRRGRRWVPRFLRRNDRSGRRTFERADNNHDGRWDRERRWRYDKRGRLTRSWGRQRHAAPGQYATDYTYDAKGKLASMIVTSEGQLASKKKWIDGALVLEVRVDYLRRKFVESAIQYERDAQGAVRVERHLKDGVLTRETHRVEGRAVLQRVDHDGDGQLDHELRWKYAAGLLQRETLLSFPSTATISDTLRTYDKGLLRRVMTRDQSGAVKTTEYVHDDAGLRIELLLDQNGDKRPDIKQTVRRDACGRPIEVTTRFGGAVQRTVQYRYDEALEAMWSKTAPAGAPRE